MITLQIHNTYTQTQANTINNTVTFKQATHQTMPNINKLYNQQPGQNKRQNQSAEHKHTINNRTQVNVKQATSTK